MIDYFIGAFVRFPAALALAMLPRRLWSRLDELAPVSKVPLASSVAGFLAGVAIGIPAYLVFVDEGGAAFRAATVLLFVLTTPAGALAAYLAATGALRALAAVAGDPHGDPLLTWIDRAVQTRRRQAAASRQHEMREALEGPEMPDRLLDGPTAGFPDAQWVVVASRRKLDWTDGTFVVAADKWYRLHQPVERQLGVGLRTFYPMSEVTDHGAIRRWVAYDFPPVSRAPASLALKDVAAARSRPPDR